MRLKKLIYSIALLFTPLMLCAQQDMDNDIIPERIVVKCSSYGITYMNNLDTYLSGYNHTGSGLYYSHEKFRDARAGNYRWKYQTLLTSNIGFTTLHDNTQLSGMANYNWSGYHPFKISDHLQLLAGAQIQLTGGALYLPSNGNNPVSAKLRTALAATGAAIYHIPSKKGDYTLRCQIDIPLAGVMFAPEFGQSYYEIFGLQDYSKTIAFSHPLNNPSIRGIFSIDIPVRWCKQNSTIRVSYTADIYQSDINDTRTHLYNHAFTVGVVKTIYKVKKDNNIIKYSPF